MITRPLDLESHLRLPSRRFNVVPLLDILFIVLFFSLLASNFVLSPGLTISLPRSEVQSLPGLPADAVLTVRSNEMLIFQDRILTLQSLQPSLREHVERRGEINLLINFDREVSVQTLFTVAELAREAGVARVQLAFDPRSSEQESPTFFR